MEKKNNFKKLLPFVKPYIGLIILSIFFAILSTFGTIYLPIVIKDVINNALGQNNVFWDNIYPKLLLIIIINIVIALSSWLLGIINSRISFNISRDLRKSTFKYIQNIPLSYLDVHSSGDILSRLIQDVETISDGLLLGLTNLFTGLMTIIGILIIMLILNVYVALLVVILTPLSLFIANFISKRTYRLFKEQADKKGEQTSLIEEAITNQKVIQAYNYESRLIDNFKIQNEQLRKISLNALFYSSLVNPSTRFINNIIYASVGVLCGLLATKWNQSAIIDVGLISAFLSYASSFGKPFNDLSITITELQNANASLERLFEIYDAKQEEECLNPTLINDDEIENIKIDDVYFSYVPEQHLIEGFSLNVKKGQTIAIVGPTGCGKTTFINLLMRFYDVNKGSISINNIDIRNTTRKDLRKQFGMVLQDTWLLSGTIKDNIRYGKEDASDEEIINACKISHCHSFIMQLENGYDTIIGEEGGSLSQGQKQLLCIARVMLSKPPILILDEATSSIDTRTEIKVQDAFLKLMEGRTTFIVAHRLSTIQKADVILVLKDGHIIEVGNHETLLKQGGFYKKLYESQFQK